MSDDDALLPDPLVAKRYNVSTRTIPRWDANLALGFPAPTFINGRKYRRVRELEAWSGIGQLTLCGVLRRGANSAQASRAGRDVH